MSYKNNTATINDCKTDIITYLRNNLFDSNIEYEEWKGKFDYEENYSHLLNFDIKRHLRLYGLNQKQINGFITLSKAVWGHPLSVTISELIGDYELHALSPEQKNLMNEILEGSFNELSIICHKGF